MAEPSDDLKPTFAGDFVLESGPRRRSFAYMWKLIAEHGLSTADFSRELLIGIFWEESTFQNQKQIGGGPGTGFGQVEVKTIRAVNKFFKIGGDEVMMLLYDPASIHGTQRVLSYWKQNLKSTSAALDAYAGVKARPQNRAAVANWKACEKILTEKPTFSLDTIRRALSAAAPNNVGVVESVLPRPDAAPSKLPLI
jgi:hypothetical protein